MRSDILTREDLTVETLREVFDGALFDTDLDDDGDLVVREKYTVSVTVHASETVRFVCPFGVKDDVAEEAAHALCNRVNDGLIVIRASIYNGDTLLLDWYLPGPGLTKKALVLAFRRFTDLVAKVGEYDTDDILE